MAITRSSDCHTDASPPHYFYYCEVQERISWVREERKITMDGSLPSACMADDGKGEATMKLSYETQDFLLHL